MGRTAINSSTVWVVCLCADWCGVCRDYRKAFESVAERYPGLRFAWLDTEDHADFLGDLDVETFPTLLVLDAYGVQFQGATMPNAATTSRLLESLRMREAKAVPHDTFTAGLVETLRRSPDLWIGA